MGNVTMRRTTSISLAIVLFLLILGCKAAPTDEAMFEKARPFQESQDYVKAVESYQDIVKTYPDGPRSDEAQFMIGFIYANEIKDIDKAREAYTLFMDKYSGKADEGMVMSAKWELEHLGRDISDIDQLKSIAGDKMNELPDGGKLEELKTATEKSSE